jgi:hypothetical protein
MKRLKFTVLWLRDHWELRGIGFTVYGFKADAVAEGVKLARAHLAAGGRAQLVIRGKDGRIQSERTYGADPRRSRG